MKTRIMLFVVFVLTALNSSYAQIPRTLSYQAVLTDNAGVPKPDGLYPITFRLYAAVSGGATLWTETQTLQVNRGLFSVVLGSVTPLGADVTFSQPYWLSLEVAPDAEMSPRLPLTSTAYSLAPWTSIGSNVSYNSGNVGIGTGTPVAKLHLLNPNASLTQLIETGGGVNAWCKVAFKNGNGQWDIGTSRGFNGDMFYMDRIGTSPLEFQLSPSGNLGLGIEPQAKLHLYLPDASISQRIQTGGGVNAWTRLEFTNGNGQWNIGTSRSYNGDQLYFYRQGAAGIAFAVQPNGDAFLQGNMSVKVLTITGGADIAEPFEISDGKVPEGSVVVIDPMNPGKLKRSACAYDKRVAGIVSGANGVTPGLNLQQTGLLDHGQSVALSGRVYTLADASRGIIEPGDLLTTSDIPGHAMKATDGDRSHGAIIGKAMSSLKEGTGLVLVLVNLQ